MTRVLPLYDVRVEDVALQEAKRDQGTPMVQLAYPRKGIWSGKNQLGVELPFELNPTTPQTVFKMDEWGFPEVWTISLSLTVPTLVAGQAFDLIGEVSFGSGGIVQNFEVDWVEGTIFSLPMNAINVRARWSALAAISGILPPQDCRVSVIAARGGIRHARATATQGRAEVIPAGAFLGAPGPFIRIPAFAKSATLVSGFGGVSTALYSATTFFQLYTNESSTVGNIEIVSIPGSMLGPTASFKVPIPANARYWTLFNAGLAAADIGLTVIWNLFDE